jgi:hypothetical protein
MDFIVSKAALFAVGLFVAILLMIEAGRLVGARVRAKITDGGGAGVGAVEAAIFGLLGLLIAFTFQGASARYDARRGLIAEEANIIGTAWLRVDLLPAAAQPAARGFFRQYLDSRLETYRLIPDLAAVQRELDRTAQLQNEIWKLAVASHKEGSPVAIGVLPALNQMFDIVTTRTMAARSHPPSIVFIMLAVMACAAAFLAGHGMSGSTTRSWIHGVGFAAILAAVVFVIIDLEFPRVGFIRLESFDQVLVDLRQSMK